MVRKAVNSVKCTLEEMMETEFGDDVQVIPVKVKADKDVRSPLRTIELGQKKRMKKRGVRRINRMQWN